MSFFGDLYRGEVHFDFPKAWKRGFVLSAVLVVASVGGFVLRGLNLGIDFEGGTAWEVPGAQEVSVGKVRDALEPFGQASAKVQFIGGDTLRVQADADQAEEVTQITEALADLADVPVGDVSVSTVGPAWGEEITRQAIRALLFFFIAIALYISVRLEWKMAIGALVAVLHDVVITVGFYAVTQLEVTPATVISFLTILGYSLYDTIVVYDRVRENAARLTGTGRMTYTAMTNLSLNQVFVRSINTTIVAVLPVISLLVVGSLIMGAVTLQEFAIALLVGLLVGS
jgi:preprotein translocase subunit SecF